VSGEDRNLPRGWQWATLEEISDHITDGEHLSPNKTNSGVYLLSAKHVRDEGISFDDPHYVSPDDAEQFWKRCKPERGDILICSRGTIGRSTVVNTDIPFCLMGSVILVKPSSDLDGYYVGAFMRSRWAFKQITGISGGTTIRALYLRDIKHCHIAIPPFAEQSRIVAKVQTLPDRSQRAREALAEVGPLLEQFRPSVLAAAFRGDLTADWRTVHPDVEPAILLLQRIRAERRCRWEQAELGKFEAQHQKPPKNWKDKYKEPEPLGDSYLPELPEGWVWSTLGTISVIQGGITLGQKKRPGVQYVSVPYLRVANVQRGYLDLSEVKAIEVTLDCLEQLRLQDGDLLFNEGGDRDKLGRGWVWKSEIEDCIHQNHVFRARLLSHEIIPELISHYANEFGREFFFQRASQTVNLASINKTQLSRLPVPVIPLKEQQVLATLLDAVMQLADELQAQVDVAVSKLDTLDQSILAKAFRGELVPQDPHDEPASVLLERIRAQPRRQAKAPKQTSKLVQTSELAKIASRLEPQQLTLVEVLRTAD
jgi:type I restriction enzyme S subunit